MDEGIPHCKLVHKKRHCFNFAFSSSDKVSYRFALGVGLLFGVDDGVILAADVRVLGLAGPAELEVSHDVG